MCAQNVPNGKVMISLLETKIMTLPNEVLFKSSDLEYAQWTVIMVPSLHKNSHFHVCGWQMVTCDEFNL